MAEVGARVLGADDVAGADVLVGADAGCDESCAAAASENPAHAAPAAATAIINVVRI
jgi:hypothetical protein